MKKFVVAALLVLCAAASANAQNLSAAGARAIARDAYIYGFPLVDNYRIQYSYFVDRRSPEFKAPWNTLHNEARVYTPDDKAIQTPNSDTPYSQLGADLGAEPLVITVPAVEDGRYYSLQFIDAYTFNFAYVGSRATGNGAASYLLAGPRWNGQKPAGIKSVIRSDTRFVFVLYRTQLFGPDDIGNVKRIQAGYKVQTLSQFLGRPAAAPAPKVAFIKPLSREAERKSAEFFTVLNFVLQYCRNHPSEDAVMARFARLGIGTSKKFDPAALTPEIRKAIEDGIADAWQAFETVDKKLAVGELTSADLFGTRAYLGNDYLRRMAGAVLGIYGNSKQEAIYPAYLVDSEREQIDASKHRYTLRFAPGQLPPVNAFWSLTMYDLPARLLVANPLKRYLINSPMLPGLKRDADGGLTLFVQHESPGKDKEANWLPAPNGPFSMAMRLYWPKPEALDGQWKAPPLQRAAQQIAEPQARPAAPTPPASDAQAQPAPPPPTAAAPAPVAAPASTETTAAQSAPAARPAGLPVTVDNFIRAESDLYIGNLAKEGGLGKLHHRREPASIDNQTVIRLNRDTLYTSGVFDLDAGQVTITLPDAGKRFMSLEAISQDHYATTEYGAGPHSFNKTGIGARYMVVGIRTLVDPADPNDIAQVHALQDAIAVAQDATGALELPSWDTVSQKKVRDALLVLGSTMPDFRHAFGTPAEVDPVRHLIATAAAWGGNPDRDAVYLNVTPSNNDGATVYKLDVKDVPVDAFWSVSVYDAAGYFEKNPFNAYTVNNLTAKTDEHGVVTIQFGGCDGRIANCVPTPKGWNYTVRLYRPRAEILDGSWSFPQPRPVN
jgi:hypothetical protein